MDAPPQLELPELYDALMTTRAMRRLSEEPIAEEVIAAILAAAVQAPSGGNIQPYQFLVVTDPDRRRRLAEIYRRAWERYEPAVAAITPAPRSETAAAAHRRKSEPRGRCWPDRRPGAPAACGQWRGGRERAARAAQCSTLVRWH